MIQKIDNRYYIALAQVSSVIKKLTPELQAKIPDKFMELIESNKSDECLENEILPETKAIMSLIYRDYLCDENLKSYLKENDEKEIKQSNSLFEDNKIEIKQNNVALTVIKEKNFLQKFLEKIKEFFSNKFNK